MQDNVCGEWFVSETRFGTMVHAKLGAGEENSGKLVACIRQKAAALAKENARDWVIIDGPPGIGCPVMASLSGVNAVLLVTEPTCSGLHDAARVIDLGKQFKVPVFLVVNKCDINPAVTKRIEAYCQENGVTVAGRLPFDRAVVEAVVAGKTIMETDVQHLKDEIIRIWERVRK
jgi:MinD superfamily P-loop ATPase